MEKKYNESNEIDLEENVATSIPPIESMPKNNKNSHLYRAKESQVKRNVILTIIGVIVLMGVLITVGPQLLVQFSVLLDSGKRNDEQLTNENEEKYIPPPYLEKVEKATKESTISVSGRAEEKQTIEIYINDSFVEKKNVNSDGKFTFANVNLKEGENTIKVRAIVGKQKSNFSDPERIIYREKAPDLEITNPNEGDSFTGEQSTLKVTGKSATHAKVTINDTWAIMDDEGNFQHTYSMQSGENKLMIIATDEAGNKTEKEVKFNYSP